MDTLDDESPVVEENNTHRLVLLDIVYNIEPDGFTEEERKRRRLLLFDIVYNNPTYKLEQLKGYQRAVQHEDDPMKKSKLEFLVRMHSNLKNWYNVSQEEMDDMQTM
jgi:hypothetical protein